MIEVKYVHPEDRSSTLENLILICIIRENENIGETDSDLHHRGK